MAPKSYLTPQFCDINAAETKHQYLTHFCRMSVAFLSQRGFLVALEQPKTNQHGPHEGSQTFRVTRDASRSVPKMVLGWGQVTGHSKVTSKKLPI